jgi:hypothetical protein
MPRGPWHLRWHIRTPDELGKRVQRGRCGLVWQVSTRHTRTRTFPQLARPQGGFSREPGLTCHAPATHATGVGRARGWSASSPELWDVPRRFPRSGTVVTRCLLVPGAPPPTTRSRGCLGNPHVISFTLDRPATTLPPVIKDNAVNTKDIDAAEHTEHPTHQNNQHHSLRPDRSPIPRRLPEATL